MQGNLILELLYTGRMTSKELEKLYSGHIGEDTIFYTCSHKSYMQFAINIGLKHKKIKRGKHKEDIYHIQHINAIYFLKDGFVGYTI